MSRNGNAAYLSADRKAKRARRIRTAIQYVLAVAVLLIVVFPLYWMLISSVKSQEEILLLEPTLWPKEFHFENYINVFERANFGKYYYNTIVMTAGLLISQIVTGVFAAYGFSKGKFKGQNLCFLIVLGALMIPLQVTFIPIYIMCANWGLSDTFLGLILRSVCLPTIFLCCGRPLWPSMTAMWRRQGWTAWAGLGLSPRYWRLCANPRCLP